MLLLEGELQVVEGVVEGVVEEEESVAVAMFPEHGFVGFFNIFPLFVQCEDK